MESQASVRQSPISQPQRDAAAAVEKAAMDVDVPLSPNISKDPAVSAYLIFAQ